MKADKAQWDAETARLEGIRRAFWKAQKQVQAATEEGIVCHSRTDASGNEKYHLVDRDGRILSGEYGDFFSCWMSYLGKD